MENYSQTYAGLFYPVPDKRHWSERSGPTILPHEVGRSLGRPSFVRIRVTMDDMHEGHM